MIERLTQQRKEELLGNYFAGGMSAAEEQEFFVQVALDDDLRQMLKAHSIVRSALDKGHSLPSVDHHMARTRLIATLEARHREPAVEPASSRRPAIWWSVGLLVITSLVVAAGLLLRPDISAEKHAVEVPAAAIREMPAAKERTSAPAMEPEKIESWPREARAGEVPAKGKVTAPSTLRATSRSSDDVVAPKSTATRHDSVATTPALTPAVTSPRSSADTIREKSRDTLTMRLKVRKIVE